MEKIPLREASFTAGSGYSMEEYEYRVRVNDVGEVYFETRNTPNDEWTAFTSINDAPAFGTKDLYVVRELFDMALKAYEVMK